MASLNAHLLELEDHGRLGFHPDCPTCRAHRMHGRPPSDAMLSPRSRAALGALLLAGSSLQVAVAPAAAQIEQETEGSDGVEDGTDSEPGFEPGLEDDLDSYELPLGVETPSAQAPALAPEAQAPAEVTPPPSAPPPVAPVSPQAPKLTPPTNLAPPEAHRAPLPDSGPLREGRPPGGQPRPQRLSSQETETSDDSSAPRQAPPPPDPTAPSAGAEAPSGGDAPSANTGPATSTSVPAGNDNRPGARAGLRPKLYVVGRGDSLWGIAEDHLEPGAGPATIAREVNRLWDLNADRIATGQPDLLMVGTVLRLA